MFIAFSVEPSSDRAGRDSDPLLHLFL